MGSPFPDSGIDQYRPDDDADESSHTISHQHSWPGAISTPEGSERGHETKNTKPMSQSVDRSGRRDGIYAFAPLSKIGSISDKNSMLSPYDGGALANHLANESTESTSSGGSMDKATRDDRSASTSTSGAHSASSKLQSTDAMSSENSASFRPINDQSLLESPFTTVSTHSTTSDPLSFTTSGQHSFTMSGHHQESTLPMPYMHLYHNIIPGVHQKLPTTASGATQDPLCTPASVLDHSASGSAHQNISPFVTPSPAKRDSLLSSFNDSGGLSSMPFFSMLSPSEILDRHIEFGTSVHSKELSRLVYVKTEVFIFCTDVSKPLKKRNSALV